VEANPKNGPIIFLCALIAPKEDDDKKTSRKLEGQFLKNFN
jgi:hypothetical protein